MKFIIFSLFIVFYQSVLGQSNKAKFKIVNSKEKYYYSEDDSLGNSIFSKNVGMNGPITSISASDYDSLNREIKSYWAHSNVGYYLNESVYEDNTVKNYKYELKIDTSFSYNRETLNKIDSRKEFIESDAFIYLQNGKKSLRQIDYFDSSKNRVKEIFFAETGDTSAINTYEFNDKNQEVWFHKGDLNSEMWSWDIYYLYDENSNRIKSTRVSSSDGIKDTTEVRNFYYNEDNLKIAQDYYYRDNFQNRSEYIYNKKNQIVGVLFYERDEDVLDAKTIYKYDRNGDVKKKIVFDYRKKRNNQKEVSKFQKSN